MWCTGHQGTTTEGGRKFHLSRQYPLLIYYHGWRGEHQTRKRECSLGIGEVTKIKVYRVIVLTTLLYGCETWTTYHRHIKKLTHFHTTCLRKILHFTYQKRIPDIEVLIQASLPCIYIILTQSQLRWAGHVITMKDHRLPNKNWSMANCLRVINPKEARKSTSKTHWSSPWNLSVSPRIAWNVWRRTETSIV